MSKPVDGDKVATVMVEVFNFLKKYKGKYTVSEVILGIQGALSILVMKKAKDEGKSDLIDMLMKWL